MFRLIASRILLSLSLVLLLGVTTLGGLNVSGYCWSERRYLSDVELFRSAIKTTNFGYGHLRAFTLSRIVGYDIAELSPYSDVEQFIKENPDCCKFYHHGITKLQNASGGSIDVPLSKKILGSAWAAVAIRARVKFVDAQRRPGLATREVVYWVDSCGMWVQTPIEYLIG
jgi:hypothetical protein